MKELIAFINNNVNKEINDFGKYLLLEVGYANGYVAVPKDHPYYGKSYSEIDVDVHGGLTFSSEGSKVVELWSNIELIEGNLGNLEDYWIFGFDTCHHGDNLETWTREAVISETLNLKRQLEGAYE